MPSDALQQRAWVERVLGYRFSDTGQGRPPSEAVAADAAGPAAQVASSGDRGGRAKSPADRDPGAQSVTVPVGTAPPQGAASIEVSPHRAVSKQVRSAALAKLTAANPRAATAAKAAFDAFATVLGEEEATAQSVQEAGAARNAAEKRVTASRKAVQDARALPSGTKAEKLSKKNVRLSAGGEQTSAEAALVLANARETALLGQLRLSEAIKGGPLSGDTGRPFSPDTAEKLITGYKTNPRLADAAVAEAGMAQFPDAVADELGAMIGRVGAGFKSGRTSLRENAALGYGKGLLKQVGNLGPGSLAGLDGYLTDGLQFQPDPLGESGCGTYTELARRRTAAIAGKLVQPDGSVDPTSTPAKTAIGHALFHPDSIQNQTPALTAHLMKTVEVLSTPDASRLLKGVTAPHPGSGAGHLVGNPTGGSGAPTAQDARVAVVDAMLTPLDQGNVGSCFATAPARRLRLQQPLKAMASLTEMASTGICTPPFGDAVPVVTNLPDGENKLLRSWEYSTASASARKTGSSERSQFERSMGHGLDQMKASATDSILFAGKKWKKQKPLLQQALADEFTFVYDPLSDIGLSNDGSSDKGRFVLKGVGSGNEISSEAEFIAQFSAVALKTLKVDPASKQAKKITAVIGSKDFLDKICPNDYKPWALGSGGQTPELVRTLFGDTMNQKSMLGKAGDPKPTEGERTKQVLTSFLTSFKDETSDLVTIRTVGQHGFNAMPNHPSLAALKGTDETETAQKINTALVQKGAALKNTDLTAERAAYLFDQQVANAAAAEPDDACKILILDGARASRPTAAMKPVGLAAAMEGALSAWYDEKAKAATDQAKKKEELKASTANALKAALILDLGAPEFVIADTNWGDERSHTFFVVAPDPTTGDPMLWEKETPPGLLTPAGRDWVDCEWASIQPGNTP